MPDPLFDSLYHEVDKLRWPAADQVRRRGHLARVRRRATVAVVAVLGVLAGGALAGQALGGEASPPPATEPPVVTTSPSPSEDASPTPSETAEPSPPADESPSAPVDPTTAPPDGEDLASALLQVDDLEPGAWEHEGSVDGDWSFAFSASLCAEQLSIPVESVDSREQAYRDGSQAVIQTVHRYAAGDAERYLDYVRTQVDECGGFPNSEGLTVFDEGFAGADSLFIQVVHENGGVTQHIFVRQGDLVTEVWAMPTLDADAIPLAQRAADRLCNATTC